MTDLLTVVDRVAAQLYPYRYLRGPNVVRSWKDAEQGMNCGAFVHLLLRDAYGTSLPPSLMCWEMLYDEHYLDPAPFSSLTAGDVVFFGGIADIIRSRNYVPKWNEDRTTLTNLRDHPRLHLALCLGREVDELYFAHTSPYSDGVCVESLPTVISRPPHQVVYAARRLRGH